MKRRALNVIKYGAVLILSGCAYAFFVMKTGISVPCVFRLVTGLKCPGCGITHMCLSLLRFDFKEAWNCNAAVFAMLPLFAYLLGSNLYRYIKYGKNKEPKHEKIIEIIMLAVLIVFGIARNMPVIL